MEEKNLRDAFNSIRDLQLSRVEPVNKCVKKIFQFYKRSS